jgi:16S rRNA processing protein RimM
VASPEGRVGANDTMSGTPPGIEPERAATRLVVALVRGLHGLRGAVRLEILTDDPRRFSRGSRMYPEGSDQLLTVAWSRRVQPGVLVRFREVSDRATADLLRERYLEAIVEPGALPEGTYYWHEIVGTDVQTTRGETIGVVEDIFRVGEGEVYQVRGDAGEVLVPAVSSVIVEFAPRSGRIVVDAAALGLGDAPVPKPRGRRTTRARRRGVPGAASDAGATAEDVSTAEPSGEGPAREQLDHATETPAADSSSAGSSPERPSE